MKGNIVDSCQLLIARLGDPLRAQQQIERTLTHRRLPSAERLRLNEMLSYIISVDNNKGGKKK